MSKSWRERCAPIIAGIIERLGVTHPNLRHHLRNAYPFGERKYHPYKVWLSEIAYQTGKKPRPNRVKPIADSPGQMKLFDLDEEQSFAAEVLVDPHSEEPWMVYADWMMEKGYEDLADRMRGWSVSTRIRWATQVVNGEK